MVLVCFRLMIPIIWHIVVSEEEDQKEEGMVSVNGNCDGDGLHS